MVKHFFVLFNHDAKIITKKCNMQIFCCIENNFCECVMIFLRFENDFVLSGINFCNFAHQ